MGSTLSSLIVALGLDISDFKSGLADVESESQSMASKINSGLSGIGGAAVAGIGAVTVAAGAFLASTVGPASDLNETVSKVGVVFGSSAAQVVAFGETAANSLGMSQNAALAAAGTYGNLFRAMGMAEQTSADMSTSLVGLAGDLASFNNMDPTEVMDALRAGLSGETEPLKRLGVNINEAIIKQKALANGLWDGQGPLTAAAKAQSVYALIMEQTTLAQGDFARTSGGVANQQRIMAANFEDLKAKIGTGLLPLLSALSTTLLSLFNSASFQSGLAIVTQGIADFAAWVVEKIPLAIDAFQGMVDWLSNNQGVIVAILAVIGVAIGVWAVNTAIAIAPVVLEMLPLIVALALIGAAAYLLYEAWTNNWGGIQEKTAAVWAWLRPILQDVSDWFAKNIPIAMQFMVDFWNNTLLPALKDLGVWLATNIPLALTFLKDTWDQTWVALGKSWVAFYDYILPAMKAFHAAVEGDWYAVGFNLRMFWELTWKQIGETIMVVGDSIVATVYNLMANILAAIYAVDWGSVGSDIVYGIARGIEASGNAIGEAAVKEAFAALELIKGLLGIQSPSKVMRDEVGWQMGAGVMEGWKASMAQMAGIMPGTLGQLVPAGIGGFSGSVPGIGGFDGGGGPQITVIYNDNAVVSSARESEIAEKLGPAIVAKMRQYGAI